MVLEAASNIPSVSTSLSRLNSDLLDITTLYQVQIVPTIDSKLAA